MNASVFKKNLKTIDTSSLVDKVEKKLVDILQQKKLKVGDSIPKELELAETLGVSRTVVREALLRLRMMGL
jgi:GntR family transcriptional regulator, transcriptional repressor for pyruvate dehydrogenase complex